MKWYMLMPTWDMNSVSLESVSLVAKREWAITQTPRWCSGPQRAPGWETSSWEAEVLSGALRITQSGMIKRSYGSMWQSPFVSLRPSVCLSHLRQLWPLSRIKCESNIFITKCYGHSSSMYIHSLCRDITYTEWNNIVWIEQCIAYHNVINKHVVAWDNGRECSSKNFTLLFSAGIVLTVEVSISYFRPTRMVYAILPGWLSRAV